MRKRFRELNLGDKFREIDRDTNTPCVPVYKKTPEVMVQGDKVNARRGGYITYFHDDELVEVA